MRLGVIWFILFFCNCENKTQKKELSNKCEIKQPAIMVNSEKKQIKNGDLWECWPNGKWKKKAYYKDGKMGGRFESWYADGVKKNEGIFQEGQLQGRVLNWYDNGQLKAEAHFVNGKQHGKSVRWSKQGKKETESYWHKGLLHGVILTWYDNGKQRIKGEYFFNKKCGRWETWNLSGKVERQEHSPCLENKVAKETVSTSLGYREKLAKKLIEKFRTKLRKPMTSYSTVKAYYKQCEWIKKKTYDYGILYQKFDHKTAVESFGLLPYVYTTWTCVNKKGAQIEFLVDPHEKVVEVVFRSITMIVAREWAKIWIENVVGREKSKKIKKELLRISKKIGQRSMDVKKLKGPDGLDIHVSRTVMGEYAGTFFVLIIQYEK